MSLANRRLGIVSSRGQTHRGETGRNYRGVPIHAGPGVHEFACELLLRLLPPPASIVEVGSGSGAFSARLRDCRYEVTLVDQHPPDEATIAADAATGLTNVLGSECYDAVVAVELVEHLGNPQGFLKQAYEVLRPAGLLLLSTPNIVHPYSRLKFLVKGSYWLFDSDTFYSTGHSTPFPDWLWVEWLSREGFTEVRRGFAGTQPAAGPRRIIMSLLSYAARRTRNELGAADSATTLFLASTKSGRGTV